MKASRNLMIPLALLILLSGCDIGRKPTGNLAAFCTGLGPYVDAHVDALIEDGGPKSKATGKTFVAGWDGGCK